MFRLLILITIYLFLFIKNSLANSLDESRSLDLQYVKNKYELSYQQLEDRIAICENDSLYFTKKDFESVQLTEKEVYVVLYYFFRKNNIDCYNYQLKNYLFFNSVYARLQPSFSESIAIYENSYAALTEYKNFIKDVRVYEKFSHEKREKIENIKNISKPFNLIKSLELLGL